MERLGDHFPQEQRQRYVNANLVPGQVVYLFCDFTSPPKEKYLVLVAASPEPLLFVVNSSIPPFVRRRPALRTCQVALSAADHPFLDHDSVINCAEVIRGTDQPNMIEQLVRETWRVKGPLNEAARKKVLDAVRRATTIPRAHKKQIEAALGS